MPVRGTRAPPARGRRACPDPRACPRRAPTEEPGKHERPVREPRTGRCGRRRTSAGLAVRGVRAAARAELLQLDPVGIVATVLLGDVVALRARERDLGADVGALAGHGENLCVCGWCGVKRGIWW